MRRFPTAPYSSQETKPIENASLLTVPQLGYRSLYQAVRTWLLGLNPRRIQACLPLVAAFHGRCVVVQRACDLQGHRRGRAVFP
ncbi:hypothetical protein D3C87_1556570 [compost metagenome]